MWEKQYKIIVLLILVISSTAGAITYSHATFATQREYDNLRNDIHELRQSIDKLQKELVFKIHCLQ